MIRRVTRTQTNAHSREVSERASLEVQQDTIRSQKDQRSPESNQTVLRCLPDLPNMLALRFWYRRLRATIPPNEISSDKQSDSDLIVFPWKQPATSLACAGNV